MRVLVAATLSLAVIGAGLALVFGFPIVMLLFGAVLIAVFLRGLADHLADHTPLKPRWAVGVILLVLLGGIALVGIFAAPQIGARVADVSERVPEAAGQAWSKLQDTAVGRFLPAEPLLNGEGTLDAKRVRSTVQTVLSTGAGVVADLAVVLIVGLYLAISPARYRRGVLKLVPRRHRDRARDVMSTLGSSLGWWMVGRLSSMAIVGVASGVGLALIGVPLPWTLGALTGLLCFVPFVGPLLALAPPLLFAWLESGNLALAVLGLYGGVQVLESYVVTPLIQQRTVLLPAALVIVSQTVFGFAAGPLGIMLAVPLAVVVMVLVREVYVRDVLGEGDEDDAEPSEGSAERPGAGEEGSSPAQRAATSPP